MTELTKKQIKQIEKLTKFEFKEEKDGDYIFERNNYYEDHSTLTFITHKIWKTMWIKCEIKLVDGEGWPLRTNYLPIQWLKPLSEILERENNETIR